MMHQPAIILRRTEVVAVMSLVLGVVAGLSSPLFVLTSAESQRRIGKELGLVEAASAPSGQAMHQTITWQVRAVMFVLAAAGGCTLGLALGGIAMAKARRMDGWPLLAVCLNLLGLVAAVFVCWGIS
jgi:hypothetical protein